MKSRGSLCILFVLVIILYACSNQPMQPGGPEGDSISEAVDVGAQEPEEVLSRASNVESRIAQIKNGDFSDLTDLPDYLGEYLKRQYVNRGEFDWLECDLNETGLKGLIWQQKDSSPLEIKRIEAIFAVKDDEARLVCSPYSMQGTEYYFISKNGNIIYQYSFYGTSATDYYAHYRFQDDWSKELVESLTVILTEDWAIDELKEDGLYEEHVEKYPYWAKAGVYYTKGSDEALEEPEFLQAFEKMTGYSFYDDNPIKPNWMNW